jgi:hypothetical protein
MVRTSDEIFFFFYYTTTKGKVKRKFCKNLDVLRLNKILELAEASSHLLPFGAEDGILPRTGKVVEVLPGEAIIFARGVVSNDEIFHD